MKPTHWLWTFSPDGHVLASYMHHDVDGPRFYRVVGDAVAWSDSEDGPWFEGRDCALHNLVRDAASFLRTLVSAAEAAEEVFSAAKAAGRNDDERI